MHPFLHHNRLSRFVLTFGVADMVIGGVDSRISLFLLGLTIAGIGLLLRWSQRKRPLRFEAERLKILPPANKAVRRPSPQQAPDHSTQHSRGRRIY